LQPNEILAVAVKAEIEAAAFYSGVLGKVKNELLQQKLEFLVHEEEQHQRILRRLFSQRFPGKEVQIPEKSFLPPLEAPVNENLSVLDLFKIALQAEKISEEFYKESQKKVEDKGSRKMLEYLSRVERSHYFVIKSEIDLLSLFPDYYDVEDFHIGQDLFHVGP
jgi:rubrerythrin